jgi:UDP-GlcNAc:undecaprenyl-phosphate/decaprenyl-phosphate GlcNAc-1-phosphate transferase
MNYILLSTCLAFLITYFAIPVIIRVAKEKKLFDEPDARKVHKTVIPTLGGLGIFAGFILATLISMPLGITSELQFFLAATIVIFFLGIKDDILMLSATKKFAGQLLAAGIIIFFGDVQLNNMYGFLGIHEIPYVASVFLTFFTIIVITNSFNLIDGVDGLAGSLALVTSLVFGVYFYLSGEVTYSVMAFALAGTIVGFLIYNFSPAKIFMGDTGSLLLGLLNSIFVVKFINTGGVPEAVVSVGSTPAVGFAILIVPLFDTLRVFALRIISRRSPFSPDRNHIHHFLLDLGLSHMKVVLVLVSANIMFIGLAWSLQHIGTTLVLAALATAAVLFVAIVYYSRPKPKIIHSPSAIKAEEEILKPRTIFKLASEPVEQESL